MPHPGYWTNQAGDFRQLMDIGRRAANDFQELLDRTYLNRWTRDRTKHNRDNPVVPRGYSVSRVMRNENSHIWKEYCARRLELLTRAEEATKGHGQAWDLFPDVKSTVAWREIKGSVDEDRLSWECNEWYLLHGTHPAAAQQICSNDFKVSLAGLNTGTLYGRGLYFAESITKADEYAKPNGNGDYAVLLCRVLGGRVKYTAEQAPDPEDLVCSCVEGPFDCVLGDREKCRGTFKEFVLYDSEDVYPEYIIEYRRQY